MNARAFIPLQMLSRLLGLPRAWLKAEAQAGRIPYLRTDRKMMFDIAAVKTALAERAEQICTDGASRDD